MKILAFEFSARQRSVAALNGGCEANLAEVVSEGTHAVPALAMAEEVLGKAGLEREQVDTIVVGLGPGSYNGIRVALALARGWELARPVRLLGLSTVDALAWQAASDGLAGHTAVVIDAQRGEVYLGEYELQAGTAKPLKSLRLASPADVQACGAAGVQVIGPEVLRWWPQGTVVMPRAATLARMILAGAPAIGTDQLEPIYLREVSFVKAPPPRVIPGL